MLGKAFIGDTDSVFAIDECEARAEKAKQTA